MVLMSRIGGKFSSLSTLYLTGLFVNITSFLTDLCVLVNFCECREHFVIVIIKSLHFISRQSLNISVEW